MNIKKLMIEHKKAEPIVPPRTPTPPRMVTPPRTPTPPPPPEKYPLRIATHKGPEVLLVSFNDAKQVLETKIGYKCEDSFMEQMAIEKFEK
jgi:hypothetical protein